MLRGRVSVLETPGLLEMAVTVHHDFHQMWE